MPYRHKMGGAVLAAFLVVNVISNATVAGPIHEAAKGGDILAVKELIQNGAKVNDDLDEYRATALYWAAVKGHGEIVELLLEQGAVVDQKNGDGDTVLHAASAFGHKDIVQLLLSKGAAINEKRKDGTSALHVAVDRNRKDVVDLLLASGADVNARNRDGVTPLYHAAGKNLPEIVTLLLAQGADFNAPNTQGDTPLHVAAAYGNNRVVELLLSGGAKPSMKNSDGKTPAQLAVQQGRSDIVQLFESLSGFTTYTNEMHGFSIKYPAHWNVLTQSQIQSMTAGMSGATPSFAAQSSSGSLFVMVAPVTSTNQKLFSKNAQKGLSVQYAEFVGTPPTNWVRMSSAMRTVNGVKALLVEWKMPPMQGVTLMQKHLCLIIGKTAFLVSATSDIQSWKENDMKSLTPTFESFQVGERTRQEIGYVESLRKTAE